MPIPPGSCFGKTACQLHQRPGGRIDAVGPFPMPSTPELLNPKKLQTFISAITAVNPISCEFLLIVRYFLVFTQTLYCLGILSKSGIPKETCRSIQCLVQSGELYWARHLKVNIDLGRPSQKKHFGVSGAISFKMLLKTHEQFTQLATRLKSEMWNHGTSDSFYPPDQRHKEHFITATGSTGIDLQPINTATIIMFTKSYR